MAKGKGRGSKKGRAAAAGPAADQANPPLPLIVAPQQPISSGWEDGGNIVPPRGPRARGVDSVENPIGPPPAEAPQRTTNVSRDFGVETEISASTRSDATIPIGAPPAATDVMLGPVRGASVTVADRENLIRHLDAIEADLRQIRPTLEAIRAALDERPQIGHNNPPEDINILPIDDADLGLMAAAITAARVEIAGEQARADVLRLSALSLQKVGASFGLWLATKADTFAEAFAKSAGTEAGKRLIQAGALVAFYDVLQRLVVHLGDFATHILKIVGY